ncbi:MAG: sugar transferase [Planctomycetota bacterium]|nr:sugar transferase [Planctomycetaceae bacterium]MDQ3331492.1 sugar transferase [Planctomycetota bacterium]
MNSQQISFDVAVRTAPPKRHTPHHAVDFAVTGDSVIVQPLHKRYVWVKPLIEYPLAVVISLFAIPIVLIAALATKITSSGPCFFRQTRVGLNGREFQVVKIRTMVVDAEALTGPVWSLSGDPRITRLGRFLRASHIDEFPQLLNVLRGEMSLIGPRPERPEFVAQLEWQMEHYSQRLNVRPGITGLAQMLLPPDSDTESVRIKLKHDLYYVRHMSLLLDLKILVHTAWDLTCSLAGIALRFLQLPQGETVIGFEVTRQSLQAVSSVSSH